MAGTGGTDAELVGDSLEGNRDAFGQIVRRYQSLICSLAYSATGCLGQSEDLAQETFITAWKHLRQLREPAKLRSWLCGIARNRINNALRREGREPLHAAEPLASMPETPAADALPADHAINREEEAILWRSLERIPETYREPLVLFYREHQSVERVAEQLELSEDAVKQRLSRGRKLLHEQVLAFVEGALERTAPGKAFTMGVLATLPVFATSASAATVATAAAKGGTLAKSAAGIGLLNAVVGPILIFVCTYLGYRMDHDEASSPQRRAFVRRYYRLLVGCIAVFVLAVLSLTLAGLPLAKSNPMLFAGLLFGLGAAYLVVVAMFVIWIRRQHRRFRREETSGSSPLTAQAVGPLPVPVFEYKSRLSLLGWPLVHIRLRGGLDRGPVKAWIAVGDAALGLIFAFGAVAVAPISFGGFAVGLLTIGGFALGPVTFGGFSLGWWALGGMAVGWQACGGCALAWSAAQGGMAVAHDFALGGVALARHANDAVAEAFFKQNGFSRNALAVLCHAQWMNLFFLVPLALWWRSRRARRQQRVRVEEKCGTPPGTSGND